MVDYVCGQFKEERSPSVELLASSIQSHRHGKVKGDPKIRKVRLDSPSRYLESNTFTERVARASTSSHRSIGEC